MRLVPAIDWTLGDADFEQLDPRLMPLLEAVDRTGSLAAGVTECGISYRAAWGMLKHYEAILAAPLVKLERGRGARLTPLGARFVEGRRAVLRRLEPMLPPLAIDLDPRASPGKPARLRIAASHDFVLASLAAAPGMFADGLVIEPTFMGSLSALESFAQGKADAAGFHVPSAKRPRWDPAPFLRTIRGRGVSVVRFIDREQGLILPRGNPAIVRSFADIGRKGLRFVNRQAGSGTRLLIDALLAAARLPSAHINGYLREEFTHGAVSATVASGGADAGFGLRAAAAEYGLDFVSLARERYLIALRTKELARPAIVAFRQMIASARFAEHVRSFPGCSPSSAGSILKAEELAASD